LFADCLEKEKDDLYNEIHESGFDANVEADEKGDSYEETSSSFSGNISERFLDEAQETEEEIAENAIYKRSEIRDS
jgi:hypothetical protein